MKKTSVKKGGLQLRRESIRALDAAEGMAVNGGTSTVITTTTFPITYTIYSHIKPTACPGVTTAQ